VLATYPAFQWICNKYTIAISLISSLVTKKGTLREKIILNFIPHKNNHTLLLVIIPETIILL